MCRLLVIKSEKEIEISSALTRFADKCRQSKEYQGHGWGCAYLDNGWRSYKNINPIWEEDFEKFGSTKILLAHARSAFEDKDIVIENNMPFQNNNQIFIFNGELQGVRIRQKGRIGAEKIFNYIQRFHKGDLKQAISKAVKIIRKRTKYVKAMNFIILDKTDNNIYLSVNFNERPEYFTMYESKENGLQLCSIKLDDSFDKIPNNLVRCYK